jgi:myo-inositol-1(or 4)-monophosphatase
MSGDLDLDALLPVADEAARRGGEIVASRFRATVEPHEKGPGDWVSEVDTESERAIRASLADSGFPVFGEEEGGERAATGWVVDPLDGTANFLHGFPVVGVSVALVHDGSPVVGVVHAPLLHATFAARLGGGATADGVSVTVSDRDVEQAICATGFPFRAKRERLPTYFPVFETALVTFEDLRRAGSASLDLAWTAAGVFDGYFEQALGPWDVAAGALLVREAGGAVTDWAGDDRAWLTSGDIVAGSPATHAATLEIIRSRTR